MPAELRVGILGCGFIARTYHVPALRQVPNARIVALANPTLAKAEEMARDLGLSPSACTPDPYTVIQRPDVDAVLVLTPNDTHRDLAVAAAHAGKHALVQKPFARTAAECREMIVAARNAETLLAATFPHRYFPEVRLARDYLRQGLIGRPTSVRVRNAVAGSTWATWFHSRERTGGGAGIDVGVHGVDLFRLWFGEILDVQARMATLVPARPIASGGSSPAAVLADNEDNLVALYGLADDVLGVHEVSWSERARSRRFEAEIRGDEGAILVRSSFGPVAIASRRLDNADQWILPFVPWEPLGVREHQTFVDAALGLGDLDATAEDGLAAVRVAEALYRSAARDGARTSMLPGVSPV